MRLAQFPNKKSSYLLEQKFVISIAFLIILLQSRLIAAYGMDLDILNLYLSDNPKILAMGGVDFTTGREDADLYHPADLVNEGKNFISYTIADENVFNKDDSDWEDIAIRSREYKLTGIIHRVHQGMIKKNVFGFQYGDDIATGHADYTRDNFQLDYRETTRNILLTCGIQAWDMLAVGGGMEKYNDETGSFWEAELMACPFFSMGVRNLTREFHLDLHIEKEENQGMIPIHHIEDVSELTVKIALTEGMKGQFIIDAGHPERRTIRLSFRITKRIFLGYLRHDNNFCYHQDLLFNGAPGGHNNGDAEYTLRGVGLRFMRSEKTSYYCHVSKFDFFTEGAGLLNAEAVLSFWEKLLAGKRYFNYSAGLRSVQYHIGAENRWTERLTVRGGLQYIDMRPDGIIDHWVPFPFIGIGRLDEEIVEFSYSRIILGVFAAGFSYRIKNFEVSYGFGQYIPLSLEKRGEDGGVGAAEGEKKKWYSISWDDIKDAWDKFRENQGGSLHMLETRWNF